MCACIMRCAASLSSSVLWNRADHFLLHGIRMTLCHAHRKCSLPERTAENIPHTWQHGLKIAQKPLIHHYRIFARQAWDPRPFWSRFDVCNLHGYLTLSSPSPALSSLTYFLVLFPLYLFLLLFWGFCKPAADGFYEAS